MKYKSKKSAINIFRECKGMGNLGYRNPVSVIESIKMAKNELSYSNYDNANLDIAIKVIKRFCKEYGIPNRLGGYEN